MMCGSIPDIAFKRRPEHCSETCIYWDGDVDVLRSK